MPDYSKGLIYTIKTGDNLYVGSTTNFTKRKYQHKWRIDKNDAKLYKTIRENGGEWDMKPYKEFPCENKTQLTIEEERIRCELNTDLNSHTCYGKDMENYKNYQKKYQQQEKYKNERKEYRDKNKEYYKEYNKEYGKIKITCECGCVIHKRHIKDHKRTKKHLKLLDAKNPIP